MNKITKGLLAFSCCYLHAAAQLKSTGVADIYSANKLLSRTINIGFAIKSPEAGGILVPVKKSNFEKMKIAGFTAVRLPVDWVSGMASSPPYNLDNALLTVVDHLIHDIRACNLAVILDNHTDEQLMMEPVLYRERFLQLWKQLSSHYEHFDSGVIFELMAEPHGQMDNYWNEFLAAALKIVREKNPVRPVIVGPVMSNRPQAINSLVLPEEDRNIIVTFHQYSPINFTMQGETWFPIGKPMEWMGTRWPAGIDDQSAIVRLMDFVSNWAAIKKRPVFLGEFGVSNNADTASSGRWIRFNREEAEKRNFSWGYWSMLGVNFSLIDPATGDWRTACLNALMPGIFHPMVRRKKDRNTNIKPAPGITGRMVMEKCIVAMGGQKAIAKVKDITLEGSAQISGTVLNIKIVYIMPEIFSESVSVNGNMYQHTIIESGWADMMLQGKHQEITAEELERLKEKAQPFTETFFLSTPGYMINLEGILSEGNEDFYQVKVHSPMGRELTYFYDVRTKLRRKITGVQQSSSGDSLNETIYADYQKAGDVLWPRSVTNKTAQLSVEAHFQVRVNSGVAAAGL